MRNRRLTLALVVISAVGILLLIFRVPDTERQNFPFKYFISGNKSTDSISRCKKYNLFQSNHDHFDCVPFYPVNNLRTPICIYDVETDKWISKYLKTTGVWEGQHLQNLYKIFRRDPDLGLIDIGANIGTWTLAAAKMGRSVVAVEPSVPNVRRIHKSCQLGNLSDKITLLQNAVSDTYGRIKLKEDSVNQGIKEVVSAKMNCSTCSGSTIQTILMDDILEVLPFGRAVLKVDVEGHEMKAFAQSEKLFKTIFIPYIVLEWQWYPLYWADAPLKRRSQVGKFIRFFYQKNYRPYDQDKKRLDPRYWTEWPNDVYWKYDLSY